MPPLQNTQTYTAEGRPGGYADLLARRNRELRAEIQRRRDIERQLLEAQQELRRSHDRYVNFFELSPVGYLGVDRNGCIRELNLTLAKMLHRCRADLIGNTLETFISMESRPTWRKYLLEVFEEQPGPSCTMGLLGGRGSPRRVRVDSFLTPDFVEGGLICRAAVIDLQRPVERETR